MSIVTSAPSRRASASRPAGPPTRISRPAPLALAATSVSSPIAPEPCTTTVSPNFSPERIAPWTPTANGSLSTATSAGSAVLSRSVPGCRCMKSAKPPRR